MSTQFYFLRQCYFPNDRSTKCPPLQLRQSWTLTWKFLILMGTPKDKNVSSTDTPRTIQALKQQIVDKIAAIPAATVHAKLPIGCSYCFQDRLRECLNCNGGHLIDLVLGK